MADDLSENAWRHVTLTRGGAQVSRLYVDGVFVTTVFGDAITPDVLKRWLGDPFDEEVDDV